MAKLSQLELIEKNPTWRTVVSTYISLGMTEDDAVQTAKTCSHTLTWDDYDIGDRQGQIMGTEPPKDQTTKDTTLGC